MKASPCTEAQKVFILKQGEQGTRAAGFRAQLMPF